MATPKQVGSQLHSTNPWSSWVELQHLYSYLYNFKSPESQMNGIVLTETLRQRTAKLPLAIESTSALIELQNYTTNSTAITPYPINNYDPQSIQYSNLSPHSLRYFYSLTLLRLVNGLVDSMQLNSKNANSVLKLATIIGLPRLLVDIRHSATHNELPSLETLKIAANHALMWLHNKFWVPQLAPQITLHAQTTQLLAQIRPILVTLAKQLQPPPVDDQLTSSKITKYIAFENNICFLVKTLDINQLPWQTRVKLPFILTNTRPPSVLSTVQSKINTPNTQEITSFDHMFEDNQQTDPPRNKNTKNPNQNKGNDKGNGKVAQQKDEERDNSSASLVPHYDTIPLECLHQHLDYTLNSQPLDPFLNPFDTYPRTQPDNQIDQSMNDNDYNDEYYHDWVPQTITFGKFGATGDISTPQQLSDQLVRSTHGTQQSLDNWPRPHFGHIYYNQHLEYQNNDQNDQSYASFEPNYQEPTTNTHHQSTQKKSSIQHILTTLSQAHCKNSKLIIDRFREIGERLQQGILKLPSLNKVEIIKIPKQALNPFQTTVFSGQQQNHFSNLDQMNQLDWLWTFIKSTTELDTPLPTIAKTDKHKKIDANIVTTPLERVITSSFGISEMPQQNSVGMGPEEGAERYLLSYNGLGKALSPRYIQNTTSDLSTNALRKDIDTALGGDGIDENESVEKLKNKHQKLTKTEKIRLRMEKFGRNNSSIRIGQMLLEYRNDPHQSIVEMLSQPDSNFVNTCMNDNTIGFGDGTDDDDGSSDEDYDPYSPDNYEKYKKSIQKNDHNTDPYSNFLTVQQFIHFGLNDVVHSSISQTQPKCDSSRKTASARNDHEHYSTLTAQSNPSKRPFSKLSTTTKTINDPQNDHQNQVDNDADASLDGTSTINDGNDDDPAEKSAKRHALKHPIASLIPKMSPTDNYKILHPFSMTRRMMITWLHSKTTIVYIMISIPINRSTININPSGTIINLQIYSNMSKTIPTATMMYNMYNSAPTQNQYCTSFKMSDT